MIGPTDTVSLLDHNDLMCCGRAMIAATLYTSRTRPGVSGHGCGQCGHFMSDIAFLQNSHGTRAQRRARIANKEVGHAA